MQPTAFGAQDRCFFEIILCDAPRRRLMGRPLGGSISSNSQIDAIHHRTPVL